MTLVGFSLGARVIFRCLQILAESETNGTHPSRVDAIEESRSCNACGDIVGSLCILSSLEFSNKCSGIAHSRAILLSLH